MNYSQRIKVDTSVNADKNIKVRLDKNISNIEILSLNINQTDIYQSFNADYGVLIGRVLGNGAVGVPNAKVSIFIPITDQDKLNSNIKALYPYESPDDLNNNRKRYNLLPRVATVREDGVVRPKQPFGSFPTKEETLTNDTILEVYEKYYKYSTVTNSSGDYMLFGVPVGTQTVHMSVDITDIGRFSMTTTSLITNLGYSDNFFVENGTKFKETDDLLDLPHIDTQEVAVDVIPFWGDTENFEIGITRQDFRIKAQLINTFTIFGSSFTDSDVGGWGEEYVPGSKSVRELYRAGPQGEGFTQTASIGTKRNVNIEEQIFYINNNISDQDIESGSFDPSSDYTILDKSSYTRKLENGNFVFIINCNRKKIITNEAGDDVVVDNDNPNGIFTEFRGFAIVEITEQEAPLNYERSIGNNITLKPLRLKFKIPQNAITNNSFSKNDNANTENWRKQNYKFSGGSFYSVSKFQGTVHNNTEDGQQNINAKNFLNPDLVNIYDPTDVQWDINNMTGVINTSNNLGINSGIDNEEKDFPFNISDGLNKFFGGTWLNFSLHFPQHTFAIGRGDEDDLSGTRGFRSNTNISMDFNDNHFYFDNTQEIAGGITNTKALARSDLHYTDFINVPLSDILKLKNLSNKGFTSDDITLDGNEYKNGLSDVPDDGGRINANPNNGLDNKAYFYKGLNQADCIKYLEDLNII